ncbi:MAG: hypothetical protein ACREQM_06270, partial [Candidatus Dormibacteraceae bacterium]
MRRCRRSSPEVCDSNVAEQRNQVPITEAGLADVQRELTELVEVRRPDVIQKIRAAREHGDLSENFEYHA